MAPPVDWIHLTKMKIPCVLGIFPWERRRRTTLCVELSLGLDLDLAARGELETTVDYGAVFDQIRFIARHGRWPLIESLAVAMARHLLSPPAPAEARRQVERVRVRLEKPEALQGRAWPSVELERDASWCTLHRADRPTQPVTCERVLETEDTGAYHVELEPGASFRAPATAPAYLIAGRVDCGDRSLRPGDSCCCGEQLLVNRGALPARLLVVADPLLQPSSG